MKDEKSKCVFIIATSFQFLGFLNLIT